MTDDHDLEVIRHQLEAIREDISRVAVELYKRQLQRHYGLQTVINGGIQVNAGGHLHIGEIK